MSDDEQTTECPECGGSVPLDDVFQSGECPHCGYSGGGQEPASDSWPDGDPCPECGEPMDVGAVGNPGDSITWQECDGCNVGWGPFTGYVDTTDGAGQ